MRLLLDTHALLWWLAGDARLSPVARVAIETPATVVLVSAVSAWEIATKHRLGKLPGAGGRSTRPRRLHRRAGVHGLADQSRRCDASWRARGGAP
jgi:PIN domain nuclease of toxin-antitoxin system